MAELHAVRVAAMLSADPEFELLARFASEFAGDAHELADALRVDAGERILLHDLHFLVDRQEAPGVVPAHGQCGLREVVGAETEELGILCDFVRDERGARDFDHRAHEVVELDLLFLRDLGGHTVDKLGLKFEFLGETGQRYHDFGADLDAFLLHLSCGLEDGADLHLGDLRIADAEAAPAVSKHRVELVQVVHAFRDFVGADAELVGQSVLLRVVVRQELVERRVE